jgi:leucyl aminopeptidase
LPKIVQHAGRLTTSELDRHHHLVVVAPAKGKTLPSLPHGDVIAARIRRADHELDSDEPFTTVLPNKAGTELSLAGVAADIGAFDLLTLARRLIAPHAGTGADVAVTVAGLPPALTDRVCEALVAAAAARQPLPNLKSKPDKKKGVAALHIYGHRRADGYARTLAEARGNHLARALTVLPPNLLTPTLYRARVLKLARRHRWKATFYDTRKLGRLGAGAFLAVAQGSPEPDAGILHLRYTPARKTRKKSLALVGKGICFDTGGTNLKPAKYMHGMHEDMEGSAVALGTLLALTELKVDFPVDCWLALAQNHIGPRAYKQNDVVTAMNGTTIEVMHTDAEGRMILADTLTLASRAKPGLIVDYATLTGACVGALSTRVSGVLTNRPAWVPTIIEAGEQSGERVWPFPLYPDYAKALKSDVADVKQCTLDNDADHILAATFLKKFIDGDPGWVHVDLSSGNHKGGLAHVPTDTTGFGVRFTLNLLLDRKII